MAASWGGLVGKAIADIVSAPEVIPAHGLIRGWERKRHSWEEAKKRRRKGQRDLEGWGAELCPQQTQLWRGCGQEARGFLGNVEPFQHCWDAQKRETKAKQVSYSTPLALAAICTALPAPPLWQKLSASSSLAGGTGWAGRLAGWAGFGSRCCQVSVPGCCTVQLQQTSPHYENKAKSPQIVDKGKELEEREFLQLENKVSRQFHHAVSGHAAAMSYQATCLATLRMQCRRKWEEMNFWYANYPPKAWSIKQAVSSCFTGRNVCVALVLVELLNLYWTTLLMCFQYWSCQEKVDGQCHTDPASACLPLLSVGSGFGVNSVLEESRMQYSRGNIWLGDLWEQMHSSHPSVPLLYRRV